MKRFIKKILREHKDPRLNQPLVVGDVVELMYMDDPYNPIAPLTRGVVMGFEPTPGMDKILVRWIIDGENEEFRNFPMIPEADIWRKITPEQRNIQEVRGTPDDEKIDNLGLPTKTVYDSTQRRYVPTSRIPTQLFFKVVRGLVNSTTKETLVDALNNMRHLSGNLFSQTLKLYGINPRADRFLNEKLFWATYDNWDGFNSANPPTSYEELELRPLKEYEIAVTDYVRRNVAIDYTITEYGYSADEVEQLIHDNDDGLYSYYEWDNSRNYYEEIGDEEWSDHEVGVPQEVGTLNESLHKRIIKENESPEENDIIDDLKELVRTWDACEADMPVACKYKTQVQEVIYKYTNLPLTEDYMSHSTEPLIGDGVKNNNPGCTHYGSEGVIEDIEDLPDEVGKTITYRVTNDGKNYSNGDVLTKTMDQLIPLQEPMNEGTGGRGGAPPSHKFDKIGNKIVQNLLKQYTCGEIDQMNRQGEYHVHSELTDMLKLYGRHLSPTYEYYPKQLVQFIVDKGCPDDYTQFIGEELAPINKYTIGQSYTETDTVRKTAEIVIYDTNFQSAMCTAKDDFWDYEPDVYDTEIIDSDYYGDEEWDSVDENGTNKWSRYHTKGNDDNYDPMEVDC